MSGRAPRPDPQPIGIDGASAGDGLGDRIETGVEVEVAAVGSVRLLDDPADAAPRRRSATSEIQEQPSGESPRQIAQTLIGRAGQIGEQGERRIGVVEQTVVDRGLVELADLG